MYPREGVALVPKALTRAFEDAPVPSALRDAYDLPGGSRLLDLGPGVWDDLPRRGINALAEEVTKVLRGRMGIFDSHEHSIWERPIWVDEGRLTRRTRNALVRARVLTNSVLQPVPVREISVMPGFGALSMLDLFSAVEELEAESLERRSEDREPSHSASPELRDAAQRLGGAEWAPHIRATDPRFGELVLAVNGQAVSAADAAEQAAATSATEARQREIVAAIERLENDASRAQAGSLQEEMRQLAYALTGKSSGAEMVTRRLGLDGRAPMTLDEAGKLCGVTRERVRQVEKALRTSLEERGGAWTPVLNQAIGVIDDVKPATSATIERALDDEGLIEGPFCTHALFRAAETFGFEHDLGTGSSGVYFTSKDAQSVAQTLGPVARRLVEHWGATTTDDVVAALASGGQAVDEQTIVLLLEELPGFGWLERDRGWFWLANVKRNRLLNQIEKVMTVAGSIDLAELRDGVGRPHRMKGFRPPRRVLGALCEATGLYQVADGRVRGGPDLPDWRDVLGANERMLVEVLFDHGPVMQRSDLEAELVGRGFNRNSFYVYLTYSAFLRRFAPGVFGLRGAPVTAADIEAMIPPRTRSQVLQDHGWTKTGEPWAAFRVSEAGEKSGVLTAPKSIRAAARGSFDLYAPDESPVGTVVVEQNMWGLSPFFRRWGIEAGDYVALSFDLEGRRATIEAGDRELLLRYQQAE